MRLPALLALSSALMSTPALAQAPQIQVYYDGWQRALIDAGPWLTPLGVLMGPIIGFGMVCITMALGFRHLGMMKKQTEEKVRQDDHASQRRERLILASSLAGELNENKIKCEAFITIYSELLRNLRETDRKAMYEDTGDFIHQYPPLSRKTFEANIEKINLLGLKLASDVTNAYASIRNDAEYFTLDATMPRANAVRMVEMVLDDAQRTLEPLDSAVAALNMIVRDGSVSKSSAIR